MPLGPCTREELGDAPSVTSKLNKLVKVCAELAIAVATQNANTAKAIFHAFRFVMRMRRRPLGMGPMDRTRCGIGAQDEGYCGGGEAGCMEPGAGARFIFLWALRYD